MIKNMKQSVIVIGSGITGVSCAEELRRSGAKVTLIDRVKAGDPRKHLLVMLAYWLVKVLCQ